MSVLVDDGPELKRLDYAEAAWEGPPAGALGWWRSRIPQSGKPTPAPPEVLLGLLDEWAGRSDQAAARYVLALLLLRRRIAKPAEGGFLEGLHGEDHDAPGPLRLVCPERDEPVEVAVVHPTEQQTIEIQARLTELLGAA